MPDPKSSKLLFTHDTMLPSLSPADSTIVSPLPSFLPFGPGVDARSGLTFPQSDAACCFDSRLASGTDETSGSALYLYKSAYASFLASTSRCQYFGFVGPRLASVWPGAHFGTHVSRTLSISLVAHACDGGGSSSKSNPWYELDAASTH